MEKRNAIVFIDGSNFYHNSKSLINKPSKYEVIVCSPRDGFSNELRQGKFRYLILNKKDLKKCLK